MGARQSNFLIKSSAKVRAHVPAALKAAYDCVSALAADAEFLRLPSVQLGHLRAWAAELAVKHLVDTGKWPFDYEWQPYKNKTGNWLRLRLSNSMMSVHQLGDPSKMPRQADYRTNGFLNNQGVLGFPELVQEERLAGLPHLLLRTAIRNYPSHVLRCRRYLVQGTTRGREIC